MFSTIILNCVKNGMFIGVMALMFLSMISFSSNVMKLEYENTKIQEMTNLVSEIHGVMQADSSRVSALTKIVEIMTTYNNQLKDELKYEIANEIYEMSLKYKNLDVDLICATITHESAFTWQSDIKSPAGAMGLMQIMPYTGYLLSKHEKIVWTTAEDILFNPIYNIRLGSRYLSTLINMYHLDGGLAAYNGGERRAAKWLASGRDNQVLYEETREYVPAVLKLYDIFRN